MAGNPAADSDSTGSAMASAIVASADCGRVVGA
jgi:hypothetical protein